MKIVIIGASGTIGQFAKKALEPRHEIISVSRKKCDICVDMADISAVKSMFEKIGHIDAVVVTAGDAYFGPLAKTTADKFAIGINSKLSGQINVVLSALPFISDNGSITLTSGMIGHETIRQGTNIATANAGIEGFVRAAAVDLPRGIRINAVAPAVLTESIKQYEELFPGYPSADGIDVGNAYRRSVESVQTGHIFRIGWSINI